MRYPHRSSTLSSLLKVVLVTAATLLLSASFAAQSVSIDQLLDRSDATLDGSTSVMDRRGNPAAARELIQRAIVIARNIGDDKALGKALAYEVRAAGAAGDYVRGQKAAQEAEAFSQVLTSQQRLEVQAARQWFSVLADAQTPVALLVDRELRFRQRSFPSRLQHFRFAPTPGPDRFAVAPSAYVGLVRNYATLVLARLRPGEATNTLLTDAVHEVTSACAATDDDCPWDALFSGELLQAVGRADAAAQLWSTTADLVEAEGDAILLAIAHMRAADALVAPLSSPFELNMPIFGAVVSSTALSAGKAVSEFEQVPSDRIDTARSRYQKARMLLARHSCPRCEVDLDAREAFLLFATGRHVEAGERLREVSKQYERLGDAVYAPAAAAAAASALMVGGRIDAAAEVADALAGDLMESESLGAAMGAARLFGRVAFRVQHTGADPRSAERILDIALSFANRHGLTQVGADLLGQKSDLLESVGRRYESVLLERQARNATQLYVDAAQKMIGAQEPNQEELGVLRVRLFASALQEFSAFLAEGDVPHAREALDQMRTLIDQGFGSVSPEVRQYLPTRQSVDAQEVALLVKEAKFDQAVSLASKTGSPMALAGAHLAAGHRDAAKAIALREAYAAIDEAAPIATDSSGLENLQQQRLRFRIQEAVQTLLSAHAAAEAKQVLAALDARWKRTPNSLEWLFADDGPWVRDIVEAGIAEGLGDLGGAEVILARARSTIALAAASLGDLHAREGFDADQSGADRAYVRVLAAQGRAVDSLLALESSRGRIYHQQLVSAQALAQEGQGEDALRSWWRAEAELRGLRLRAVSGESVPLDDIRAAEGTTEQLRRRLDREAPALATLVSGDTDVDTALIGKVGAALTGGVPTTLVAYFVSGDDIYAWVITAPAVVQLRKLPGTARELRPVISEFYNRVATPQDNWQSPARTLYRALVQPIEDLLPRSGAAGPRPRLGIVPHSGANLLPFAALVDDRNVPLIERFDIFYSPSLRTYLGSAHRVAVAPFRIEAFGYNGDLAFAEEEASAVARPPYLHIGAAATSGAILEAAQRPSVLHLATHAAQVETNPFAAHLATADGALTLAEMVGVPWRAGFVTLSACDTAAGRLTEADEFTGISRGLLAAGVPAVLMTRWRIDDQATNELMKRFYRGLASGIDPVVAIGDAQRRSLRARGDVSHPFFWAAFMIMGADR